MLFITTVLLPFIQWAIIVSMLTGLFLMIDEECFQYAKEHFSSFTNILILGIFWLAFYGICLIFLKIKKAVLSYGTI